MPDLDFQIINAEVKPYAAVPTLSFKLQITNAVAGEEVYAAAIKCQVIVEATKRSYSEDEKSKLREVFGEPKRWEETVKGLFWTNVTIPVPRFTGSTVIDVPIASSEDHLMAAGKYFYSVKDGEIPLAFLFSGTLFYKNAEDKLQVTQVPWNKEAAYKMPAFLWQQMMDTYFPNARWIQLRNDIFDKLYRYKAAGSFPSLESCIESLLEQAAKKIDQRINEVYEQRG